MAAPAIVEVVDSPISIVHLVHPFPVRWSELMQHISHALCLPLAPYPRWLAALEAQSESSDPKIAESSPALKLLEFFQYSSTRGNPSSSSMTTNDNFLEPSASCKGALEISQTLRNAQSTPLGMNDVQRWLAYWRSVGFIPSRTRSVNEH